jgi:Uma2 family endonuclease
MVVLLPDHTQLPDTDGLPVENFQEHPQSIILTESIMPMLLQIHPDGQFAIGQNSGIYYQSTDPPQDGCKAPDWYYVPGVPPGIVEGRRRRSYVLWRELVPPQVLMEFVSGDGSEERDRTPISGKFWVYERVFRAPYYVIFNSDGPSLEVNHLVDGDYQQLAPNERGHFTIALLKVELGIWWGTFQNNSGHWLRWYDLAGQMLPTDSERAEQERQRAEQERQRAERLAQRLRSLGVDPDQV